MVPIVPNLGRRTVSAFEMVRDVDTVVFRLDGQERWVIDRRRFEGAARLVVQRTEHRIQIDLLEARYPGTELRADLSCELRKRKPGWQMGLRLAHGSFRASAPFEEWLLGDATAYSSVDGNEWDCRLGSNARLSCGGAKQAIYNPDGTLRLIGRSSVRLRWSDHEITADSVIIRPKGASVPSLVAGSPARGTLLSIPRSDQAWSVRPQGSRDGEWAFLADDNLFDLIHVELSESPPGHVVQALLAEALQPNQLRLAPRSGIVTSDGRPFTLPLCNARYAVAFDPAGDETAVVADIAPEPTWLKVGNCEVMVGGVPGTPQFEWISRPGEHERLHCTPELLQLNAPLADAVTRPFTPKEGTRLAVRTSSTGQSREDEAELTLGASPCRLKLPIGEQPVLRPEDLLVLRFEFTNLVLCIDGKGTPRLVRDREAPEVPTYITVHFPVMRAWGDSELKARHSHAVGAGRAALTRRTADRHQGVGQRLGLVCQAQRTHFATSGVSVGQKRVAVWHLARKLDLFIRSLSRACCMSVRQNSFLKWCRKLFRAAVYTTPNKYIKS